MCYIIIAYRIMYPITHPPTNPKMLTMTPRYHKNPFTMPINNKRRDFGGRPIGGSQKYTYHVQFEQFR